MEESYALISNDCLFVSLPLLFCRNNSKIQDFLIINCLIAFDWFTVKSFPCSLSFALLNLFIYVATVVHMIFAVLSLDKILLIFLTLNSVHLELADHPIQILQDCPVLELSDAYDLESCFILGWKILNLRDGDCVDLENPKEDKRTCKFHFDTTQTKGNLNFGLPASINFGDLEWSCRLSNSSSLCNGVSECLTDECGCHDSEIDVFYCADGSGCIAWSGLCDDVQDCMDGSDECFCYGHVVIPASEINSKICMSEYHFCSVDAYLLLGNMSEAMKKRHCHSVTSIGTDPPIQIHPIESCLRDAFLGFHAIFSSSPMSRIQEYCRDNCSHISEFDKEWAKFCKHVDTGYSVDYHFVCDEDYVEFYHISILCDGQVDCSNHADEIGCPLSGRFYCKPNVTAEWVSNDKVCDDVKDCANGADECGTCQFEALSSSEFLIQSKIILAIATIMGILIITLNMREGYRCWTKKCIRKTMVVDRILLMQIFAYDALMGVYLLSIVIAAVVLKYKGDYCILEQQWRGSSACSALGVIFSLSSHGSLLAIASISITRFITCESLVADIRKRAVVVGCLVTTLVNFSHSVVPLMPITAIKDVFRTGLYLSNLSVNPFFNVNPMNLSRLEYLHEGMFHHGSGDTYSMINDLRNVTSIGEIFDVIEISYYGNTGLCVHNIFKDQELFRAYKLIYCTVLLALLILVTTAYIKILLKQRKSIIAVNPNAADSTAQDSNSTTLTVKVALMIGSQLLCWISFIITVMYFQFLSSKPASPMVFEAFALVVIPINSFLNPVFYSELYKKIKNFVCEKWRKLVNFLSPIEVSRRIDNL